MKSYHNTAVLKFDDDATGNAASGASVTVRINATQAIATIFDLDDVGTANPLTADTNGNYAFKAGDNIYDIIISEGTANEVKLEKVEIAEIPTAPILINDLSQAYEFDTWQLMVDSLIEFPLKKPLRTKEHTVGKGGGADYISTTGASPDVIGSPDIAGGNYAALQNNGAVDAKQYGIFTGTDISTAFNAMQDAGVPCEMEGGSYTIKSPLVVKVDTIAYGGRVIFDADSLADDSVGMSCTNESDILGFDVDCANSANMGAGFSHQLDFEPTRRLQLDVLARNVTSTNIATHAYGCLLVVAGSGSNTTIKVRAKLEGHNILAGGTTPSKGVLVSVNVAGITADVILDNPRASKIYPIDDGDGIHITDADHLNPLSKSVYQIIKPITWDCSKRGMKSQAANATWESPYNDLDLNDGTSGSTIAIDTYGVNCSVLNPITIGTTNGTGDGSIRASGVNFLLVNPLFDCAQGQNFIRIISGADNYKVDGGRIIAPKSYASEAFTMVAIEGTAYGSIELDSVINESKTATIVDYTGSGDHTLKIKEKCEGARLFSGRFCTGKIDVTEGYGDFSSNIINITGEDGDYSITGLDAITTGANAAVVASPVRFHGTGKLSSLTNGILYNGTDLGAKVTGDWRIIATADTGLGVEMNGATDATISGVESSGFLTHISASFSTNCAIMNNLARGGGTGVSAPSSTGLVTGNNLDVA